MKVVLRETGNGWYNHRWYNTVAKLTGCLTGCVAVAILGLISPIAAKADFVAFDNVTGASFASVVVNDVDGLIGNESYVMDPLINGSLANLNSFQWVGGIVDDGSGMLNTVQWLFFDENDNFVNAVQAQLPQQGFFIWTLTIPFDFQIPTAGVMEVRVTDPDVDTGWFTTSTPPSVGSSPSQGLNAPPGEIFSFSLTVIPEPSGLGIIGLAVLGCMMAGRRRRR